MLSSVVCLRCGSSNPPDASACRTCGGGLATPAGLDATESQVARLEAAIIRLETRLAAVESRVDHGAIATVARFDAESTPPAGVPVAPPPTAPSGRRASW